MGNSVSDSVIGGSSQSHLARGRFEGGSRSFRDPRIAAFERGTRPRVQIEKVPIVLNRRRRVWGRGVIERGRESARAGLIHAPVRGAGLADARGTAIVARTAEVAMVTVGDGVRPEWVAAGWAFRLG
tara:strand:+ start:457 stop:837 length:381 start_codon:yes stop_codon:yes gene_type:complete